ncbi:hypothetical protein I7I53_04770 [Histoplasma capsulatum var. duboisii H88]|uniref:Uncharacterized protein n=1 Tax=Ajellomyces capsulatus (strain H88) TaxID=544711 RepID=A0A8A1LTA5_AJEC8|nr:hypothetical protein I7I53_04770 [Histoplasma capsulatum var. duboisii H88]
MKIDPNQEMDDAPLRTAMAIVCVPSSERHTSRAGNQPSNSGYQQTSSPSLPFQLTRQRADRQVDLIWHVKEDDESLSPFIHSFRRVPLTIDHLLDITSTQSR